MNDQAAWPPPWFGSIEAGGPDIADRTGEILHAGWPPQPEPGAVVPAGTGTDCSAVTRFEVIDHSGGAVTCMPGVPRLVVAYGVSVELSLQDDGRTLKVFLRRQAAAVLPQEAPG